MNWISLIFVVFFAWQAQAQAPVFYSVEAQAICIRQQVGRGVGEVLVPLCKSSEMLIGALCFPKCEDGYEPFGTNLCIVAGCGGWHGYSDLGVSCGKPRPYGRGAGYIDWGWCERNEGVPCEKIGLLIYPTCRSGYYGFTANICSPVCPNGWTDGGAFCWKPFYGNGVGTSRLGCPSGMEEDAGLCYQPCPKEFIGVGPVCWKKCFDETPWPCGIYCTQTEERCSITTNIEDHLGSWRQCGDT